MEEENKEYLKILRALTELPFNVGKNLLADFLRGDYKNKSISKNRLDELENFGVMSWSKDRILDELENLSRKGLVESIPSDYNRYVKVLRISLKGQNELSNPSSEEEKSQKYKMRKSEVTELERAKFRELDAFLNGYNEGQKKAIISEAKRILCVAGAGSGKTTTLTKRIEFLVRYRGVLPKDILAITFTRKAAEEMETRLFKLGIEGVRVNTFNSFCEGILKKYDKEIYEVPTRVQSYADKILAMNVAMDHFGFGMEEVIDLYFSQQQKRMKNKNQLMNMFMNDCFSLLDYFKTNGGWDYNFVEEVEQKNKRIALMMQRIVKFLLSHMKMQGLRDYTDQLLDASNFLEKNSDAVPRFKHVLVDEYQDVNSAQIGLIDLLEAPNIFFVGDPRQSIFGWRGSDIKYILDFENKYPDSEIIHLTKNYRSPKKIVEFMNKSIIEMGLPDLETGVEGEGEIKVLDFENEESERIFIVNKIVELGIPLEEIFVLARTNRQLDELSRIMALRKIPHIVRTDETKNPVVNKEGAVVLATVHAIKGLEAKVVFLMGSSENNFPCKASDHPIVELVKMNNYDRLDEEKRLFYVAVSRAKEKLFISYGDKKPTYFITDEMMEFAA